METTTGAVLLVIGAVALFAAIVGGGVKIREIEVGSLPSKWRQGLLGVFGLVVGLIGLVLVIDQDPSQAKSAEIENVAADDDVTDPNAVEDDANAVVADDNATDENAADENSGQEAPQ